MGEPIFSFQEISLPPQFPACRLPLKRKEPLIALSCLSHPPLGLEDDLSSRREQLPHRYSLTLLVKPEIVAVHGKPAYLNDILQETGVAVILRPPRNDGIEFREFGVFTPVCIVPSGHLFDLCFDLLLCFLL